MKVVSVNVARPREVLWKGMMVRTGIFKEPVDGVVAVRELNLDGDEQADLTVHGGRHKAVYGYPAETYASWRSSLPDYPWAWGAFGENLTTEGLSDDELYIGDRVRVGSALLMVTQPRLPCYKLTIKFGRDDMIMRFLRNGKHGFYFSVMEEGEVSAGSPIEIVNRDPARVSVSDIVHLFLGQTDDRSLLERAVSVAALPWSWKARLTERAQVARGSV